MLVDEQREKTPGRVRWMRWVSPTRLVVETNQVTARATGSAGGWSSWAGAVIAFDADGGNARRLADPRDLLEFVADPATTRDFSTARGSSTNFDFRVWRPDQPVPEISLNARPAEPAIDRTTIAETSLPRRLRIFDFDARHPGAVTLVATGAPRSGGSYSLGFYSLDAETGELTSLGDRLVSNLQEVLLDRQGRPRLAVPKTTLSSFPFHYDYLGPEGRNRPRPLAGATGLPGLVISPENYFGERVIPLGFDEDPNLLYYAANTGRDTYGLYSFNLATKERGALVIENPGYDLIPPPRAGFLDDSPLVFDRFQRKLAGVRYQGVLRTTAWLRPELQTVQAELEKALPGRSVDLIDWDEAGRRYLVSTEGPADPGAFYLYDRGESKLLEFVRRAPWIDAHHTHPTLPFGFTTSDGVRLSGVVTVPRQPRMKPIPMVVLCPDQPWQRVQPEFQTEVNALAAMGFVVVQFNGRGAWGLGRKQREGLTAGHDLVQVEDIATLVATLEQLFQVNPRRVALIGRGHGGFIALRTLQTYPNRFRCAIALEAPVDLGAWLRQMKWSDDDVMPHLTRAWWGDESRLKAAPLVNQPGTLTKPALLFSYPGPPGANRRAPYLAARRFAEDVRNLGGSAVVKDLHIDYVQGLPAARAEVFDQIEAFLNEHVYDYNVKLRDIEILPDKAK
jgi:pimeloyl-ACP methyl ester carboxylesterase